MKAISLWQPWATLMAVHAKRIETRHWPTDFRGDLAIHAAKRKVVSELDFYWGDEAFRNALLPETIGVGSLADALPFGAIVAVVELYGCYPTEHLKSKYPDLLLREEHFGDFSESRYGWLTRNPRKLKTPVPARGFQSFWDLPSDIDQQVRAQL